MRETIFNLQHDWDGLLEWHGVHSEESKRKIIKAVAYEVDMFRKQNIIYRMLNRLSNWNSFN